jgi:ubiquitin C-terminal hydrolase
MSSLTKYNPEYVPEGQGFINLGATCYFNSILQCILSLPSIYEVLLKNKESDSVKKNKLAQNMINLWSAALRGERIYDLCIPIWRDIISISQSKSNRVKMDSGQQDAHEGLMVFLEAMETIPEVLQLFEHRHRITIHCPFCNEYVVDKKETGYTFEVQPDLKTPQIEQFKELDEFYNKTMPLCDFLKKQNGYVDKEYKCPKCGKLGEKFKSTVLTMIPEIIPVVFKKYHGKVATPFPEKLEFMAKGGDKKLIYQLVAQSEHSGSMGGGHYWSVALRKSGWNTLNDGSVSPGNPGPTAQTYVIFYHYMGIF